MDPNQIPFLIDLLDDEDEKIRSLVIKDLSTFGVLLFEKLKDLDLKLTDRQRECLKEIHDAQKKILLKQLWPSWFFLKTDLERLEGAIHILSNYLNEEDSVSFTLKERFDELADAYQKKYQNNDAKQLAVFLFREFFFKGNESDYDNPQNSNLYYVLSEKKGIPISLTCLYILVGARLGLWIEGCNFPGHFLARIELNGRKVLVDCFNGGQILEEKDIIRVHDETTKSLEYVLSERADSYTIVRRFLANLIRSFQLKDQMEKSQLIVELFKDLDNRITQKKFEQINPSDIIQDINPHFSPGQLVMHQRYGYRGIVVDYDWRCKASDRWYYSNQSQPDRNQPWYHILVNGSDQVTYVAESSLKADSSQEKFSHPLLTYFFSQDEQGKYVRNQNPWPETDF